MNSLLKTIVEECRPCTAQGHVANYIPELANKNPHELGIYVAGEQGNDSYAGDCFDRFTMQSVVKPMILLLALMDSGSEPVRSVCAELRLRASPLTPSITAIRLSPAPTSTP